MSSITKPVILDETGQQILAEMQKQSSMLTAIAAGYKYKPTSIADVFSIVQAGAAEDAFQIGDQIVIPWTDIATGTTYSVPLDVVHHATVTLEDGEEVPGMFVQWHYATPFGVQFTNYQAFYYCESALAAGTYNVTIGTSWGTNCVAGKTYQFTLTQDVPAGGQLAGFHGAPDQSPSNWKVYSYASTSAVDALEVVSVTEGSDGTSLGTLSSSPTSPLNGLQSVAYGYNRWSQSALRQFLNSDAAAGSWWSPQHDFDRAPDQLSTKAGFLTGFDDDFTSRLKAVKVVTAKNTITDDGELETTYDKVFIPALAEMYINPQKTGEGDVWEYWKRASGRTEVMAQWQTYPQIRTYAVENHTSAQYVRLRSAYVGSSCHTWYVNSSGGVNYGYAIIASRCAPACVIC